MLSLLNATKPYIDYFRGIRISTRPDYIYDEILILLKKYNVTAIELGAQSMCDDVLIANNRGHSSTDVIKASRLIKSYGFELGLQMMTGLYMSDDKKDMYTANEFIKLNPSCVRIYPTIPMKNTVLGDLYQSGQYKTPSLEESVALCAELITLFENNGITVIRVGLHYSDMLAKNDLSHSYHPSFRELCESEILYNKLIKQLADCDYKDITVLVNPSSVSKMIGQKRKNILRLNDLGYRINVEKDDSLLKYEVVVRKTGD